MTDTRLIEPALRWSLEYLRENIGNGKFSVYESDSHVFKYFDEKKLAGHPDFQPPTKRVDMTFPQFCDQLQVPRNERKKYVVVQVLALSHIFFYLMSIKEVNIRMVQVHSVMTMLATLW